jgi:hypothetical protein
MPQKLAYSIIRRKATGRTPKPHKGSHMGMFFDQDIAHIARVMVPSLMGDLGGPILSAQYWRGRLRRFWMGLT